MALPLSWPLSGSDMPSVTFCHPALPRPPLPQNCLGAPPRLPAASNPLELPRMSCFWNELRNPKSHCKISKLENWLIHMLIFQSWRFCSLQTFNGAAATLGTKPKFWSNIHIFAFSCHPGALLAPEAGVRSECPGQSARVRLCMGRGLDASYVHRYDQHGRERVYTR